jgi:hypothetical protein
MAVTGIACGSPPVQDVEDFGVAHIALSQAPSDASCLLVSAVGARSVLKRFSLASGQEASLEMAGLPLGDVQFSASAFAEPCDSASSTDATWVSDLVSATIVRGEVAQVKLTMHRNGRASVSIDFCDADLQSDVLNCGSCENACPSGQLCQSGKCVPGEATIDFEPGAAMEVGQQPTNILSNITSGDLDGDGWPDIALAHGYATGGVILNRRDRTFAPETLISETWWNIQAHIGATSVTLADLDLDGSLDYVFALYGQDFAGKAIQLYRGDGGGGRTLPPGVANGLVYELSGANPMATRVADFDHNGLPDIAVGSNNGAHTVDIILQTSPWVFTPTYAYNQTGGANPQWIEIGDFNNDGWPDLVVPFLYGPVDVYLNTANGTGALTYAGSYLSPYHHQVTVADFNGDGFDDIAARSETENHVAILYNDGTGHFTDGGMLAVSGHTGAVRAADLDGDGFMDLVVCSASTSTLDVLWNDGLGSFRRIPIALDEPPYVIAIDDFDQDGDPDVAVYTVTPNVSAHLQVLWNRRNP